MEVKLDKRWPLAAGADAAWQVLSDIRATGGCMPGATITEQVDATHFKGIVKSRVGPAALTFNGDIEVLALDAVARRIELLGKGSDRSGSAASMQLAAHVEADGAGAVLVGMATVTVSGKLAQFGGRLLVPVADAMLAQFADNFRAAAAAVAPTTEPAAQRRAEPPPGKLVEAPLGVPIAVPPIATPVPTPAPARNELNVLALVWAVVKSWFGKRPA